MAGGMSPVRLGLITPEQHQRAVGLTCEPASSATARDRTRWWSDRSVSSVRMREKRAAIVDTGVFLFMFPRWRRSITSIGSCCSVSSTPIAEEFGISKVELGYLFLLLFSGSMSSCLVADGHDRRQEGGPAWSNAAGIGLWSVRDGPDRNWRAALVC